MKISIILLSILITTGVFSENKKDLKLRIDSFTVALTAGKNEISKLKEDLFQCNETIGKRDASISSLQQALVENMQRIKELSKKEVNLIQNIDSLNSLLAKNNEKAKASTSSDNIVFSSFVDNRDGKTYKTVKLGNQYWMAEDLNYNLDENGSYFYPQRMLNATEKDIQEAMKFYGISPEKIKDKTGMRLLIAFNPLLELFEIKYPNGWRYYTSLDAAKKACPEGWRLPNDKDLENLNKHFKELDFFLFGLDVAWWKRTYYNPILEIRLGDYFGVGKYWCGTEIPGNFCTLDLQREGFKLNVEQIWKNHENDLGFAIRCVKDVVE